MVITKVMKAVLASTGSSESVRVLPSTSNGGRLSCIRTPYGELGAQVAVAVEEEPLSCFLGWVAHWRFAGWETLVCLAQVSPEKSTYTRVSVDSTEFRVTILSAGLASACAVRVAVAPFFGCSLDVDGGDVRLSSMMTMMIVASANSSDPSSRQIQRPFSGSGQKYGVRMGSSPRSAECRLSGDFRRRGDRFFFFS